MEITCAAWLEKRDQEPYSAPCFQSTHILPCDPPPPWPPLASYCSPHPIQDDGTGLRDCQWNGTLLPPNTGQSTRPSVSTYATTSSGRLVPASLRASKGCSAKSQLSSRLAPQWWNKLPTNIRAAESLAIFWKDSILTWSDFTSTLTHITWKWSDYLNTCN